MVEAYASDKPCAGSKSFCYICWLIKIDLRVDWNTRRNNKIAITQFWCKLIYLLVFESVSQVASQERWREILFYPHTLPHPTPPSPPTHLPFLILKCCL